jgi:hypothetical protein
MADTSGLADRVREFARARAEAIGETFVETARGFAPRRTGAGADSIQVESITEQSNGYTIHVTVAEIYMRYQNDGTGLYGPNGTPITPKNGKFLVFPALIGGGMVFARSVRGTEPTHFWERTVEAWPRIVQEASS